MNMSNQKKQNITSSSHSRHTDDFDLQKYLYLFLFKWYWFALAMLVSFSVAYFINKYSIKIFSVATTLLIEDEKSNPNPLGASTTSGSGDVISGFGLFPSLKNLQNQTLILQSRRQVERTLHSLDFEVSYFKDEVLGRREIYSEAPFTVIPDKSKPLPLGVTFAVTVNPNGTFRIISDVTSDLVKNYNYLTGKSETNTGWKDIEKNGKYGDIIDTGGSSFYLLPRADYKKNGNGTSKTFLFTFNSYDELTEYWTRRISVTSMQKDASMVKISIETDCPEKAEIFLNTLLEMYLQRTLDKKNAFANNTIEFIDKQLVSISDSLDRKEMELQNFRKNNKVVDLSFQAQQLFEQTKDLGNQKAELKIRQDYFTYLVDYIAQNREDGDIVAPSVMGIEDPLLNNLVLELNRMTDQKVAMGGGTSGNPYISTLNAQIRNAKVSLNENVHNMMNNNAIAMSDLNNRLNVMMAEVAKLPQTERELFGIERIFKLNDYIYTYLLQRRYEAQIAKASNAPDNEIIDTAKAVTPYVRPKPALNYAIGFSLGLLIPALLILLISALNNRVTTEEDIKHLTDLPVAGHIIHSEMEYQTVVLNDPQSQVSETFRSLRTRLQFFTKETPSPVVLITSSMAMEGKTFTSINLASACSLSGKKTVLVGFDLRKPKLFEDFGLSNEKGVSTFLIGRDSVQDIIQDSGHNNLSVITSGPLPPNPAELAFSEKTRELFTELKKSFDYIIVDSAPLGIVSDTFSLAAFADVTIILVRHNRTFKHVLENTLADASSNGITGISLLLNDITRDKALYGYRGSYRYGYGYGYGYGYKNGTENEKKGKRWITWKG
jgi:tyrosine-protein kinase Etk/Wzc